MSVFGDYAHVEVIEAAEKFISKMDERDLAQAIEHSTNLMTADGRTLLVEAIFDAFRARGEASQDAAEGAGLSLDAITQGDQHALSALIAYARTNPGLLKEATTALIEQHPQVLSQMAPELSNGIAQRLRRTK